MSKWLVDERTREDNNVEEDTETIKDTESGDQADERDLKLELSTWNNQDRNDVT